MPIGKCKLCLQTKELQYSHLLPSSLYKKSRWVNSQNPNPALLSGRGMVQTSKQIRDYVLCRDCEQLFSRNGNPRTPEVVQGLHGLSRVCMDSHHADRKRLHLPSYGWRTAHRPPRGCDQQPLHRRHRWCHSHDTYDPQRKTYWFAEGVPDSRDAVGHA